jgi:hypothetical protein
MGYYLRFLLTGSEGAGIDDLRSALKEVDPGYEIANIKREPFEYGDLMYGDSLYGLIEVNRPPDEEELEELREDVEDSEASRRKKQMVLKAIGQATAMVAVQALWQGRTTEETLARLDPLWKWLFTHREGMLYADSEGFYDRNGLVLPV